MIVTHAARNERAALIAYLDRIGFRKDAFAEAFRPDAPTAAAFAFLYDMSDLNRLRSASSATFSVGEIEEAAWSCYGTMTLDRDGLEEASAAVLRAAAAIP